MACPHMNREEVVERYLTGSLGPQERESFEDHYFACEECFATLQSCRALRAELAENETQIRAVPAPAPTAWRWTAALATAALVIVAVLGIRWGMRPGSTPPPPSAQMAQSAPSGPSLVELARFDPPMYTPPLLRGVQDDATRSFRAAMKRYQQGRYDLAIAGLSETVRLNPKDAGAIFFLGVSYLLSGQTDRGIPVLQKCAALGETPYLEESHYYLAKAFLQRNDATAAEAELQKVVQLKGSLLGQAQELLLSVQASRRGIR